MKRAELLAVLAGRILGLALDHPARVAIDGPDAAGKTRLADELAVALRAITARPVLRASLDRFHRPREARYQRGPDSPEGYYQDSFDLPALRAALLDPLGPGGSRQVRLEQFDFQADSALPAAWSQAAQDAILLFDGVFLQRPELSDCWDLTLFLQVPEEIVLARAIQRDTTLMGGEAAVLERYRRRYLPAQRAYRQTCRPAERADMCIEHSDPHNPLILH